jgi:hypothetical protein
MLTQKKKMPRMVMLMGNHEERMDRLCSEQPHLAGTLPDLPFERWEVYPFLDRPTIEGISFSHYFPSGPRGMAISGAALAKNLLAKGYMSSVAGHNHTYSYFEDTRWDGQKLFGLCAGCYTDPADTAGWSKATRDLWWRGITVVDNLSNGYGDVRKVSLEVLESRYT